MLTNIFGEPLLPCGCKPLTGWYLDGFCRTDASDLGQHAICSVMTDQFLSYTLAQGNNLKDPNPMFDFPGLKPGHRWCLCVSRWEQARVDGLAPPVILEATDSSALQIVPFEILKHHAFKGR